MGRAAIQELQLITVVHIISILIRRRGASKRTISQENKFRTRRRRPSEEDFDQRRRTHSREEQTFRWTDGKTSNTSFRRNETSFYGPPLIGTSIKTHSHVHTCLVNLWPRGRKNQRTFRGNIPIPFRDPIHT